MLNELVNDNLVLNIYKYGSRVYGTATEKSDFDYIVVVDNKYNIKQDNIEIGNQHFNFYHLSNWTEMIDRNKIETIETLCCDQEKNCIKKTIDFKLNINEVELRKSISQVVCNSYDKCRKKLIIEKDFSPYIARKSLWHSIRIILFGIQCCEYGRIVNFQEANCFYDEIIKNESVDWEYYKLRWHDYINAKRTEFRKLTEKEWLAWKEKQNL